jgi:hypothetical protein
VPRTSARRCSADPLLEERQATRQGQRPATAKALTPRVARQMERHRCQPGLEPAGPADIVRTQPGGAAVAKVQADVHERVGRRLGVALDETSGLHEEGRNAFDKGGPRLVAALGDASDQGAEVVVGERRHGWMLATNAP